MKNPPFFITATLLFAVTAARLEAADLLFEMGFEKGLATGGSTADLVVTERGGGGLADTERGNAWQFDGKAALEIAVPSRESLAFHAQDQFTLQAMIRLDRNKTTGAVISKGSGSEYRMSVAADQTVGFSYYSQGKWRSYVAKDHPLTVSEWAEVTVQYDGVHGMVTILIDGKLAGKFEIQAPVQSREALPLFIGGGVNTATGETKGLAAAIDDVRIFSGLKYPGTETAEIGSAPQSK